jgi:hypothetical protein
MLGWDNERTARGIPLVRELIKLSAGVTHQVAEKLTLAMPIGDADSAIALRFVQRFV